LSSPNRARALADPGRLGDRLVRDGGLPEAIAEAWRRSSLDNLIDPTQRLFRGFAEQTKSDRAALFGVCGGSAGHARRGGARQHSRHWLRLASAIRLR
jgi:hypothetical protein